MTVAVDFSEVTYIGDSCFSTDSSNSTINLVTPVVDLKNCVQIGNNAGDRNVCFGVSNGYQPYVSSNIEKVWLRSDCVIKYNSGYNMNLFNRSQCHIYTDASSKPDGWSQICTNATWHFGATHEDFELGL